MQGSLPDLQLVGVAIGMIVVVFFIVLGIIGFVDEVWTIIKRRRHLKNRKPTTAAEKAAINAHYRSVVDNAQTMQFSPLPKQRTEIIPKIKDPR